MNILLFEKALKAFDINEEYRKELGDLITLELGIRKKTYKWNNLKIYYIDFSKKEDNNNYFITVIEGMIPEEIIMNLNDRKEKENLNYINGILNNHKSINAYYIISDFEELIIFLSEVARYYNREKQIDEKRIITDIYKETIIEQKPTMKTAKYLEKDKDVFEIHQRAIDNNPTTFGQSFLEALNDFDNAVNPFMNYEESGKNFEEFVKSLNLDRLKIKIDSYRNHIFSEEEVSTKQKDNKFLLDDFELSIEDKETGNIAAISRKNGQFTYAIKYNLPGCRTIIIDHSLNKCEVLTVTQKAPDCNETFKISFNLTNNTIDVCSPAHAPRQRVNKKYLKYKSQLYTYLLTGINMAKMITINNMTQREPGKTRERIKPTTEE